MEAKRCREYWYPNRLFKATMGASPDMGINEDENQILEVDPIVMDLGKNGPFAKQQCKW